MGTAFGCGQCLPCRINRRRVWSHRMMLEANLHTDNTFVTLTYRDVDLPEGGSLVPDDLKSFLYRLREGFKPNRLRFFAVGEYGDKSERPHYHLALFGYPNCAHGQSNYHPARGITRISCCAACDGVKRAWRKGDVLLAPLEPASASYVAGYVTKKMTAKDDERLLGRHPEFARMSLKPGIGAGFMPSVAATVERYELDGVDVPSTLRHGSRIMPIGRYLKRRLRVDCGLSPDTPEKVLQEWQEEVRSLQQIAFDTAVKEGKSVGAVVKENLFAEAEGKIVNMEARYRAKRRNKL